MTSTLRRAERQLSSLSLLEGVHLEALQLFADVSPGRILDAPTGNGRLAAALADRGHMVTGLDIDIPAKPPRPRAAVQRADLNNPLPFDDNRFDGIVSIEGLEHIRRPYDLIREFGRVLRPGGVLVLSTPNILHILSRLRFLTHGNHPAFKELYRIPQPADWFGRTSHVTPCSYFQLVYAAGWAGLAPEEIGVSHIRWNRLVYLPLILWLKLVWCCAGAAPRRRRHIHVVNSLPLLLADVILIKARKAARREQQSIRVRWPRRTACL